jgi:hypothetical protein
VVVQKSLIYATFSFRLFTVVRLGNCQISVNNCRFRPDRLTVCRESSSEATLQPPYYSLQTQAQLREFVLWSTQTVDKNKLRSRALLADSTREVRFERVPNS